MKDSRTILGTRGRSSLAARILAGGLVAAATLVVSASCSSDGADEKTTAQPTTTTANATIGSKGGKVEIVGTASVVVPPGAVEADVAIGMAVVEPPVAPDAPTLTKTVAFTPHGLTLNLPAKISLRYGSTVPAAGLTVMRLPDPSATAWEQVGGVKFSSGTATFETTTFSYYVLVKADCKPLEPKRCNVKCAECCGTSSCVDVVTSPRHCGACGNDCGPGGYCNSASTCVQANVSRLCDNKNVLVIRGELPDLTIVTEEQLSDKISAAKIAAAIQAQCALGPAVTVSQAATGILDPCTDAPLQVGGTTDLIVGGTFNQRLARFFEANGLAPYKFQVDSATGTRSFVNRAGAKVVSFPGTAINPKHDYFVVALFPEPQRGALMLHVFGVGWEGTPAAVYYFSNVLLPQIVAGTRDWQSSLLVEWSDDGDGTKDAGDTFTVLARDQ